MNQLHSERSIRVLIIDDSALVRQILQSGLDQYPDLEVIGTAVDPYDARDKIVKLKPDVLTLDVEMPKMDGVQFLRKLMPQYPIPVVMVSALTEKGKKITIDALEAGAVDFVAKPTVSISNGLNSMMGELAYKIKIAALANVSHWKRIKPVQPRFEPDLSNINCENKIIAVGASTGGTEAIKVILRELPTTVPGILIVQHMPPEYVAAFAKNVDSQCKIEVREAQYNDVIEPGCALIAPGGKHLKIIKQRGNFIVRTYSGPRVSGHSPSVDVMMESVAQEASDNAYGIILTGMGRDGANGMKQMYQAGATTFAQNEETCVVFGMPKAAYQIGVIQHILPIDEIAHVLLKSIAK